MLARATNNGFTEEIERMDPRTGYVISSNAAASVQGTVECYSEAYAYARYTPENIFWSSFDSNTSCPPPPTLAASISGPTDVLVYGYEREEATWGASVNGGVPPYSYKWYRNGALVGSGSSYTATFPGDNINSTHTVNLTLRVTDSIGQSASDTHTTYIRYRVMNLDGECTSRTCPDDSGKH